MADKWGSIIENGKSGHSAVIDVNEWLGKATLDACVLVKVLVYARYRLTVSSYFNRIGAGGFDYDFGALDDADNPLTKSYTNLMCDYPPSSYAVRCANRRLRSPAFRLSGTLLDCSFSSRP